MERVINERWIKTKTKGEFQRRKPKMKEGKRRRYEKEIEKKKIKEIHNKKKKYRKRKGRIKLGPKGN